MKYCPKCGHENDDIQSFCGQCGTTLEAAQSAEVDTAPVAEPVQEPVQADFYQSTNPNYNVVQNVAAADQPTRNNDATLWLILNIVMTVLCCFTNVLSIIGIIFAALGMSNFNHGDYDQMDRNVKVSKILFYVGLGLGVALVLVFMAFTVATGAGIFGALAGFNEYAYLID